MENRDVRVGGWRTNNYLRDGRVTTTAVSPAYIDKFSVLVDSKGDRRTANPVQWTKTVAHGAHGTWTDIHSPLLSTDCISSGTIESCASYFGSIPGMPNNLYNAALSDLSDKIRGDLDLSIDAFQMGQNARMFRSVGKVLSIARGLKGVKDIGSRWLELQYGWKPLLSDIYAFPDQMVRSLYDNSGFSEYQVRGRSRYLQDITTKKGAPFPGLFQEKWSSRCEIGLVLRPQSSYIQSLSRFTSLNPASIAWELLPYSFVVDWFFNVGGYLRNLETAYTFGSRFVRGYSTYTVLVRGKVRLEGMKSASERLDANGDYRTVHKSRGRLTSYPFPRYPVPSVELGSGRLLNAAAMLSQFLGRPR